MDQNTLTTTDKAFTTAIVRQLCSKNCTFTVTASNAVCVIHPFTQGGKPAERFKEYNYWLIRSKQPDRATFIIQIHDDISGQAHKVLRLAKVTQTLIG